mmetsp:Transcript_32423/g.69456  ORF Transcript_32423/g.69456 Transcript_32423/m.69456 type:complete len:80 (+) Transcript_32423:290-529(+)|eukprot:CAMPEP_0206487426 /NCGR_PEP_ID=MMETSP0324_2-20121206/41635_1 /ASSEMBLY_ACC=CAM_ASM_000836 /TAXON_ID=2866 /ORGANISM="Crypthecodinium cohnii, Strain Seligo" /LENGTH=79 /DNA_ID=CAMNT_0053965907 /DNA_START=266 /DNA_END=505 /DNA_ORIENTATION=-
MGAIPVGVGVEADLDRDLEVEAAPEPEQAFSNSKWKSDAPTGGDLIVAWPTSKVVPALTFCLEVQHSGSSVCLPFVASR